MRADESKGIGLMMAQALEANGATVYIIGRRLEMLQNAAKTAVSLIHATLALSDRPTDSAILTTCLGRNTPR